MVERETGNPELVPGKNTVLTAGKKLAEARIAYGLSVEEVAGHLNLSVHSIKALERDDYESLPGYTFSKGYLRSYAGLLRLDPDDVLASVDLVPEQLQNIASSKSMAKSRSRETVQRKKSGGRRVFKTIVWILVLIILVLVGVNQFAKLDINQVVQSLNLSAWVDLVEDNKN